MWQEALEVHVKDNLTDLSSSEPPDTSTELMETTDMGKEINNFFYYYLPMHIL